MSRWFRFYDGVVDDPKVQRLPPILFKFWVNALCLASANGGEMPALEDMAFKLRMTEKQVGENLQKLAAVELVDEVDGKATPHNWNGRQFKSDDSKERVKAHRQRHKKQDVTADVTATVTRPETEQRQSRAEQKGSLQPHAAVADEHTVAFQAFNIVAQEVGWPVAQHLTPSRKSKLKQRLAEAGGIEGWRTAMAKARASPFLRGERGRDKAHENWVPDLDFFLQQSTFTKLMEGKYDDRASNQGPTGFDAMLAGASAAANH